MSIHANRARTQSLSTWISPSHVPSPTNRGSVVKESELVCCAIMSGPVRLASKGRRGIALSRRHRSSTFLPGDHSESLTRTSNPTRL